MRGVGGGGERLRSKDTRVVRTGSKKGGKGVWNVIFECIISSTLYLVAGITGIYMKYKYCIYIVPGTSGLYFVMTRGDARVP